MPRRPARSPGVGELGGIGVRVPAALRAVGEDEEQTSLPAALHFANVAPQPNSMSSGWAPIASDVPGTGRSTVGSNAHVARWRREDVRVAAVERARGRRRCRRRTRGRGRARRAPRGRRRAAAGVAAERSGSVRERDPRVRGHGEHRRAVVAVARDEDRDRAVGVARHRCERWRERKIGVRNDDAVQPACGERADAGGGGAVERAGIGDDRETVAEGPLARPRAPT